MVILTRSRKTPILSAYDKLRNIAFTISLGDSMQTPESSREVSHSWEKGRHMGEQDGHRLRRGAQVFLVTVLMLSLFAASAVAGEINACKYLVVTDFTSDPYGIAQELRARATAKGLVVVSAVADVSPADLLKTCVMGGSWSREAVGGQLSVRVV